MREAILIWCALGVMSVFLYWYENCPLRTKPLWERILVFVCWPLLWPLLANAGWMWNRSRYRRNQECRNLGIPHCRRHGFNLLKCKESHEAYCSGCSSNKMCPKCGKDSFFSPRFHGHSECGKPVVVYERIYAEKGTS